MTSSILALASLLLYGYIASAMRMPLTAEDSSSLGNLLKTPMNRRQPLHSDNAVASRLRRSPRLDDSPVVNPKFRVPQGQKYEGIDGQNSQLARGPYYNDNAIRGPYEFADSSFDSLRGDEIPRMSARSFDSLGGGELPWVDRRSKATARDSRIQQRAFDTLGGGEIPWIDGKRAHQRK